MNNNEFKRWNEGFKEVNKPKKKGSIQMKFDLNFKIKKNLNESKIAYKIPNKIRKQFKKLGDNF